MDELTALAQKAMESGYVDVYHHSREAMAQQDVASSGSAPAAVQEEMWEYMPLSGEGEVFGPFPRSSMRSWREQGECSSFFLFFFSFLFRSFVFLFCGVR